MSVEARAGLDWSDADTRTIDLIRVLAMDAVERAGSGHPGTVHRSVSLDHFGASADYNKLYAEFGITADHVAAAARESLATARSEVRT